MPAKSKTTGFIGPFLSAVPVGGKVKWKRPLWLQVARAATLTSAGKALAVPASVSSHLVFVRVGAGGVVIAVALAQGVEVEEGGNVLEMRRLALKLEFYVWEMPGRALEMGFCVCDFAGRTLESRSRVCNFAGRVLVSPAASRLVLPWARFSAEWVPQMDLDELVRVMETAIMDRGLYILLDNRLDLICGPGCSKDPANLNNQRRVREFAAARGWTVRLEDRWYSFSRD